MLGGGNCIDLDNYDGEVAAAVPALLADGCRYAIVGCQEPAIASGQIAALSSGGIAVIGVYAYLYWGADVLAETAKAVSVASWRQAVAACVSITGVARPVVLKR